MTILTSSSTTTDTLPTTVASSKPYHQRTRGKLAKLWIVLLVPLAVLSAAFIWKVVDWRRTALEAGGIDRHTVARRTFNVVLNEKGELRAAISTKITCQVEGRSTIISLIPEGTSVQEGDLLVELASDQIDDRVRQEELKEANAITVFEAAKAELDIQRDQNASDIRKADLKIELARLTLEKYEKGDWEQASKDATIDIEQAKITLERRGEDFKAAEELLKQGYITKTQYEEDKFNYQKAQWGLERAIQAQDVLEIYTHVADLRQRESDLEEALKEFDRVKKQAQAEEIKKLGTLEGKGKELELIQDQLAKFRRQKENCRITAPTQGFVVYYGGGGGRHGMREEDQIREGATVRERQILMSLPDTSEMLVMVRVHEAKTNKLQIGQRVRIRVEGVPDRQFMGTVTKIAVVADSQNRWLNPDLKEYETEIALDAIDVPLKPGATAHAEILVNMVEDALAVPVPAVYSRVARRYVFQRKDQEVIPVVVTLGSIGTEWAEVIDGLSGGEQILFAYSDEHKRLIEDLPATPTRRTGKRQPRRKRPGQTAASQPQSAPRGRRRAGRPTEASRPPAQDTPHGKSRSRPAKTSPGHPSL